MDPASLLAPKCARALRKNERVVCDETKPMVTDFEVLGHYIVDPQPAPRWSIRPNVPAGGGGDSLPPPPYLTRERVAVAIEAVGVSGYRKLSTSTYF